MKKNDREENTPSTSQLVTQGKRKLTNASDNDDSSQQTALSLASHLPSAKAQGKRKRDDDSDDENNIKREKTVDDAQDGQ